MQAIAEDVARIAWSISTSVCLPVSNDRSPAKWLNDHDAGRGANWPIRLSECVRAKRYRIPRKVTGVLTVAN